MALARSADGRVARHEADAIEVRSDDQTRAPARAGGEGGLAPRMTRADDDDIEIRCPAVTIGSSSGESFPPQSGAPLYVAVGTERATSRRSESHNSQVDFCYAAQLMQGASVRLLSVERHRPTMSRREDPMARVSTETIAACANKRRNCCSR